MDLWQFLRPHTPARIAQGRTGHSLPTQALLAFQLDHARARDAVYASLDLPALIPQFEASGLPVLLLHSAAPNRATYLQRPDLGRRLDHESSLQLASLEKGTPTLAIVVADGLSATAVNQHAPAVVAHLVREAEKLQWTIAPIVVIQQGRVAVADEVAFALGAEMVVMLIGERPGLSSPDSLGAYLTYSPKPGLTDESRNCLSNIRPEGISVESAVVKITYLLSKFKQNRLSGFQIKDEMDSFLENKE